jgi:hypothetical protein
VAAAALGALLLVGTVACGGGSDAGGSEATSTTKASTSSAEARSLPDPCKLIPLAKASELLGGESAPADDMDSDPSTGLRSCSWQTQASLDEPTLDGAGHILTLTVIAPMGGMSARKFFDQSKEAATSTADVDGCDGAYWVKGQLSAIKDDVLLSGAAGLADDSEDAKTATTELMATACASL